MSCAHCLHCRREACPIKKGDRVRIVVRGPWNDRSMSHEHKCVEGFVMKVNVGAGLFCFEQAPHPTERWAGWERISGQGERWWKADEP